MLPIIIIEPIISFNVTYSLKISHAKKDTKIDETIDSVAKKQINKIKVWQDNNPNWNNTDKGISDYMKIVKTLMGGNNE